MTRYGMLIDVTKCNGCYNCFLACKDEHCGTAHPGYSAAQPMTGQEWVRVVGTERGSFPKVKVDYTAITCMHCAEPACVEAAAKAGVPGAVYKRADGIVLIDPEKAKGHQELVSSCPYRVIFWNDAEQVPQKCTLCAHLLDEGWKEPRCVEACPTGALLFGDLDDPKGELALALAAAGTPSRPWAPTPPDGGARRVRGGRAPLRAHPDMKEGVRYAGLPKTFVAGCVVAKTPTSVPWESTSASRRRGHADYRDRWFRGLRVRGVAASCIAHADRTGARIQAVGAPGRDRQECLFGRPLAGALAPPLTLQSVRFGGYQLLGAG